MTIFTLRSLKKDFGIKEILKDATFSLDEGDKVGLIGTNGSGKSTLLKSLCRILKPLAGQLLLGQAIADDDDALGGHRLKQHDPLSGGSEQYLAGTL